MNIALAYVHPGHVTHGFMQSLMAWRRINDRAWLADVYSGPNLSNARNWIVAWFLEETDSSHLFMVDTDMVWGARVPDLLARLDEDIVSARCLGQNPDGTRFYPSSEWEKDSLRRSTDEDFKPDTLAHSCASGGTGAICIRREVLEALGHGPLMPFSDFEWPEPIGFTGHDVTFALRAHYAGFTSWVATEITVGHIKPTELRP